MNELTPANFSLGETSVILPGEKPLDRNPAAVYLAALNSATGRETQRHMLNVIAGIASGGSADALSFPWEALRYQHTAAIRAQLIERYKPATVNKGLSALRETLRRAWRLGLMTAEDYQRATDDLKTVKGDTLPAGRELTSGELAALLANCEKDSGPAGVRDAAIIAVMYSCGLRRAEVARLDLADYDEAQGLLIVHGKGRRERTTYPVAGARDAIADWLAVRGEEPGALFWPVLKGGVLVARHISPQLIYDMLNRRAADAGVKHFSPHDFRRTFVSDLLDAGADIVTVSKLAGHSDVTTTARYDRRTEQSKKKAASKLHVPYHRKTGD